MIPSMPGRNAAGSRSRTAGPRTETSMWISGRSRSPRGRNRGSRTAADTAAEATASPSGCSATREPMQPRSDPCSVIVTKAAPGSSSATVTGRDSCRGRGACVAAAVTASRAIRRSAVVVSGSSDTGAGRPAGASDPGGVVPSVTRSPSIDMRHLPRRATLVAARPAGQSTRSRRFRAGRHSPRPASPPRLGGPRRQPCRFPPR